ncbi:MAG: hypothetical protein QOI77_3519, partial [Blastocatellia bacterium]|nr:hypothetical protein [Blastocatellia bacterium]
MKQRDLETTTSSDLAELKWCPRQDSNLRPSA